MEFFLFLLLLYIYIYKKFFEYYQKHKTKPKDKSYYSSNV